MTKTKRYFSAESAHGDETSRGFANDTIVKVFSSKQARDRYVRESRNLSCQAIRADEATKYAATFDLTGNQTRKPEPFSGEYWGIVDAGYEDYPNPKPASCLGVVSVCWEDEPTLVERLHK